MMRDIVVGAIWLCLDCMLLHANGEYDPDRPADLPEPLSAIDPWSGQSITLGLRAEDHDPTCLVFIQSDHNAAECDCERWEFSRSACTGCGDWHHGERHAATLWQTPPAAVAQWGRECVNLARQSATRGESAMHLRNAAHYRRGYVQAVARMRRWAL